jgi:hypothetical protein
LPRWRADFHHLRHANFPISLRRFPAQAPGFLPPRLQQHAAIDPEQGRTEDAGVVGYIGGYISMVATTGA